MALTLGNPVMRDFVFYATASIAKMFLCPISTIYQRFSRNVFANPEDLRSRKEKVVLDDPAVERTRRNHLNDIENIIPFILVGGFYVLINPDRTTALWHFRAFFFSRIVHFISYQLAIPQPTRALSYAVGFATTISMMYQIFKVTY